MATQVLTDPKLYMGEYDISGDLHQLSLTYSAELLDVTTFGQTTRIRKGGLKTVGLSMEGYWSGGDDLVDDALFSKIAVRNVPITIAPAGETLDNDAYIFRAIHGLYEPGASIGEMLRFSASAEGSGGVGVGRGKLMHVGSETSTGNEAKSQVGAVAASQRMYAALHVLTVSGTNPTLDVLLESDPDASAGGETTRITLTRATGITSEWASVVGAITDTYWRATWTIGGTDTPTFEFILAIAIL